MTSRWRHTQRSYRHFSKKNFISNWYSIILTLRLILTTLLIKVQGGAEQTGQFTFIAHVLYFYNKTRNYDNVRVAAKTLVKAVLSVSSTGCNNKRQSFAKLFYSTIDHTVLTNLLPAGLHDFFQVLNVSN